MTAPDATDCRGGYHYTVSEEQLAAFARLTPLQRLEWVEAAREFTLLTETAENRERRERLRQGKTIV
ncbi:MAG: hypothetical protein KA603_08280 [Azonexus sp.]|nr:hypothetical protein [Betaproteobacteria bacterium]MBK8916928.1 hypothetical protein [Betaproteobacteria bacterium]MBP6036115.1 hypothetical protein [Azonexus sp.]MBP6906638.1 hypothetical protein [Azonexus sp.]